MEILPCIQIHEVVIAMIIRWIQHNRWHAPAFYRILRSDEDHSVGPKTNSLILHVWIILPSTIIAGLMVEEMDPLLGKALIHLITTAIKDRNISLV